MADEKKIIDVEVREKGIDELNADLARTEQNLKAVDTAASNTNKSVDDVASNGGAIAILDSLTGGLATKMRDAYEATKLFNFSLKGTKTALIATGIGAFVVALGLIVAYWDEIVELIGGANKKLQIQIDKADDLREQTEFELGLLREKQKLLELQGKSTEENIRLQKELIEQQIKDNEVQIQRLRTQLKIEESKAVELSVIEKILLSQGIISGIDEETLNTLEERKKAIDELTIANVKLAQSLHAINNPEQIEGETQGQRGPDQTGIDTDPLGPATGIPLIELQELIDIEAGLLEAARKEDQKRQSRNADAKIAIAEEEFRAKQELLFASADAAMAFGDLIGQETGKGKALAAAGALVSTWAAIAGQLKAFSNVPVPGYAVAQAIATGLVGFNAVKNILKVQVPNSNISSPYFDTGGDVGTVPTPPTIQQPDFNIVGNSGINQLADVIAEQERAPIKAFVVSEEIESKAAMDREIESAATIG